MVYRNMLAYSRFYSLASRSTTPPKTVYYLGSRLYQESRGIKNIIYFLLWKTILSGRTRTLRCENSYANLQRTLRGEELHAGHVRLRNCWCRLGRVHTGQPTNCQREIQCLPVRGWTARLEPLHPYSRRIYQDLGQCQHQLDVSNGTQSLDGRQDDRSSKRQNSWRLKLDKWPYIQSWSTHGLRYLGPEREPGLGLRRRIAVL